MMPNHIISTETRNGKPVVWLWEIGTYPDSSVLAGQIRERRVRTYDSVMQALIEYPHAEVTENYTRGSSPSVSRFAPADFDPSYAGEAWGEDDY